MQAADGEEEALFALSPPSEGVPGRKEEETLVSVGQWAPPPPSPSPLSTARLAMMDDDLCFNNKSGHFFLFRSIFPWKNILHENNASSFALDMKYDNRGVSGGGLARLAAGRGHSGGGRTMAPEFHRRQSLKKIITKRTHAQKSSYQRIKGHFSNGSRILPLSPGWMCLAGPKKNSVQGCGKFTFRCTVCVMVAMNIAALSPFGSGDRNSTHVACLQMTRSRHSLPAWSSSSC